MIIDISCMFVMYLYEGYYYSLFTSDAYNLNPTPEPRKGG